VSISQSQRSGHCLWRTKCLLRSAELILDDSVSECNLLLMAADSSVADCQILYVIQSYQKNDQDSAVDGGLDTFATLSVSLRDNHDGGLKKSSPRSSRRYSMNRHSPTSIIARVAP